MLLARKLTLLTFLLPVFAAGNVLGQAEKSASVPSTADVRQQQGARSLNLEDKAGEEQRLLAKMQREPGQSRWSRELGYLYALGILGVDQLNRNGVPKSFNPEEAEGAFAQKSRAAVQDCSNADLCGIAGKSLYQFGALLEGTQGRPLEPELIGLSEQALWKANELQPGKMKWLNHLADFYRTLQTRAASPEEKQLFASKSLYALQLALERQGGGNERLKLKTKFARAAFDAGEDSMAESAANDVLTLAAESPNHPYRDPALHHGNLVLGRLALREDSVEEAKAYLLRAGQVAGGATLSSFGPNMSLAAELLERGESEIVVQYLELCRAFWKSGNENGTLDEWIATIESGDLPDFGANLVY